MSARKRQPPRRLLDDRRSRLAWLRPWRKIRQLEEVIETLREEGRRREYEHGETQCSLRLAVAEANELRNDVHRLDRQVRSLTHYQPDPCLHDPRHVS